MQFGFVDFANDYLEDYYDWVEPPSFSDEQTECASDSSSSAVWDSFYGWDCPWPYQRTIRADCSLRTAYSMINNANDHLELMNRVWTTSFIQPAFPGLTIERRSHLQSGDPSTQDEYGENEAWSTREDAKAFVAKAVAPYDPEEAESTSEGVEDRMLSGLTAETASVKKAYSDAFLALEPG